MSDEAKKTLEMTAGTIGRDILQALVQEVRLLPDPWPKLSKSKQDDVIDRLRKRVDTCVRMAVHLIASEGRATADATIDQVVFKQGIKVVLKLSAQCPTRHALADSEGKLCLIVVADPASHLDGMDEVTGETDQRAMDLGQEYDPKGDGKGMDKPAGDDSSVVDAEFKEVPPALTDTPLQSDLDAYYVAGRAAAGTGQPMNSAPVVRHELVARWTAGWTAWHDEQARDVSPPASGKDDLYDQAVEAVVSSKRASISHVQRTLRIGYNRAARLLEAMEAGGIVSAMSPDGTRKVLKTDEPEATTS